MPLAISSRDQVTGMRELSTSDSRWAMRRRRASSKVSLLSRFRLPSRRLLRERLAAFTEMDLEPPLRLPECLLSCCLLASRVTGCCDNLSNNSMELSASSSSCLFFDRSCSAIRRWASASSSSASCLFALLLDAEGIYLTFTSVAVQPLVTFYQHVAPHDVMLGFAVFFLRVPVTLLT